MNQKQKFNSVVDRHHLFTSDLSFCSQLTCFQWAAAVFNAVSLSGSISEIVAPLQAAQRCYIIFSHFCICANRKFENGLKEWLYLHFLLPTWSSFLTQTHQTVSLQGLHHRTVSVLVQDQPVLQVLHKVQVFEGGPGLFPLLLGRSPLIRGALQVILEVHADDTGKDVVHDHHPDVLPPGLDAVEAEKLGQQSARVLIQVLEMRKKEKKASGFKAISRDWW